VNKKQTPSSQPTKQTAPTKTPPPPRHNPQKKARPPRHNKRASAGTLAEPPRDPLATAPSSRAPPVTPTPPDPETDTKVLCVRTPPRPGDREKQTRRRQRRHNPTPGIYTAQPGTRHAQPEPLLRHSGPNLNCLTPNNPNPKTTTKKTHPTQQQQIPKLDIMISPPSPGEISVDVGSLRSRSGGLLTGMFPSVTFFRRLAAASSFALHRWFFFDQLDLLFTGFPPSETGQNGLTLLFPFLLLLLVKKVHIVRLPSLSRIPISWVSAPLALKPFLVFLPVHPHPAFFLGFLFSCFPCRDGGSWLSLLAFFL